jgi:hypothetical protein
MIKLVAMASLLMLSVTGMAQKKKQKAPDPQKFAETITAADLIKHLYIVAGAEMEGRETATAGQRKAAAYIENYFSLLGLKPANNGSFQMQYPVYKDSIIGSELSVGGKSMDVNTDFVPFPQWNTNGTQYFSEVVFVGHGIVDKEVDDYSGLNVSGKLVIMLDGAPSGYKPSAQGFRSASSTYGKITSARNKGAAGVLIAGTGFPRKPGMSGGNQYTSIYKAEQYPNTFIVSDNAAASIVGADWTAWKETGKATVGVIAQEVEKVLPELVSDTDPKTVNYNGLIGLSTSPEVARTRGLFKSK